MDMFIDTVSLMITKNFSKKLIHWDTQCKVWRYYQDKATIKKIKIGYQLNSSLPKLATGQNTYPVEFSKIEQAIDKLSNYLEMDVKECIITRLDLTINYHLPDESNIDLLLSRIRCEDLYAMKYDNSGNTRYFTKYLKKNYYKLCIYDKGKKEELEEKLLRVELRLFKPYLLKINIKTLSDAINHFRSNISMIQLKKDVFDKLTAGVTVKDNSELTFNGKNLDLVRYARVNGLNKTLKELKSDLKGGKISKRSYYRKKSFLKKYKELVEIPMSILALKKEDKNPRQSYQQAIPDDSQKEDVSALIISALTNREKTSTYITKKQFYQQIENSQKLNKGV